MREPDAILNGTDGTIALWWRQVPPWQGQKTGYLGRFQCETAAQGVALLREGAQRLRAAGCSVAIAPIDGSTWAPYRAVIDPGTAPPFALEPLTPPHHHAALVQAGFTPCLTYHSAHCDDLSRRDPRAEALGDRFTAAGLHLHPIHLHDLTATLPQIHRLIHAAFVQTPLFTPLPYAQFAPPYQALIPHLRPELIRMATVAGQIVGMVWAFPDWCDGTGRTVVLKTVARWPGRVYGGLGRLLVADCHRVAAQLGYGRIVHGMIRDRNPSQQISRHYAQPFRRYALFAIALPP